MNYGNEGGTNNMGDNPQHFGNTGGGSYNMNNSGMNFAGGGGDAGAGGGGGDGSHQNYSYSHTADYNDNNGGAASAGGYGGGSDNMMGGHHGFQPQGYNDEYGMTNNSMNANLGGHQNMGGGYSQQQSYNEQSHSNYGSSTQADAANLMLLTQATQHANNSHLMGGGNTSFDNDMSGADALASLSAPKQNVNTSSFNDPSTAPNYDQVGHQQNNMMGNESMNVHGNFNSQMNHMMAGHQGQSQDQFSNNMGGMNFPSHNAPQMDNTSNTGMGGPSAQDANTLASLSAMHQHNSSNTNNNPVSAPPMKKRWIEAGAFGEVEAIGVQHDANNEQVDNEASLGGEESQGDAMPSAGEDVAKPNDVAEGVVGQKENSEEDSEAMQASETQTLDKEKEAMPGAEKDNPPDAPQEGEGDDKNKEGEVEPVDEDPFGEEPNASARATETQALDNAEEDVPDVENENLPDKSQADNTKHAEGEAEPVGVNPFGEEPDASTKAYEEDSSDSKGEDAPNTENDYLPNEQREDVGNDKYTEGEAEPASDDPFGDRPDASTMASEKEEDAPSTEKDNQADVSQGDENDKELAEGEAEPVGDDPFGDKPDASNMTSEKEDLDNEEDDVPTAEKDSQLDALQDDDGKSMEGGVEPLGDDPFGDEPDTNTNASETQTLGMTHTKNDNLPDMPNVGDDEYMEGEAEPVGDDPFGDNEEAVQGETMNTADDDAALLVDKEADQFANNDDDKIEISGKEDLPPATTATKETEGGSMLVANEIHGTIVTEDTSNLSAITAGLLGKGTDDIKPADVPNHEKESVQLKDDEKETMSLEEDKELDDKSDASLPDGVERVTFTSHVEKAPVKSEGDIEVQNQGSADVQSAPAVEVRSMKAPLPTKLPGTGVVSLRGQLSRTTEVHKISGVWALGLDTILADPDNLKGICLNFEYEHKPTGTSEDNDDSPQSGKYSGWFHLNSDDGLSKIESPEKDIDLTFTKNSEGYYNVVGSGSNFAGSYSIIGTLTTDGVITMCRKFGAKPKPKPKRTKKTAKARLSSGRKGAKHSLGGTSKSRSPKSGGSPKKKKAAAVKHPDSGKRYGLGKPDLLCDCCFFDEDGEVGNTPFVKCLGCGLVAHTACYPPTSAVDEKGNFICDACTAFFHPSVNKDKRTKHSKEGNIEKPKPLAEDIEAKGDGRFHREDVYCELCARRDVLGGMKPTDSNSWVHLACLMCTDHAYFDDKTAVQVQGALKKNREELIKQKKVIGSKPKCEECGEGSGMLLKCKHDGCNLYTHALCAEILDRLRVVENNGQRDIISYKCELHSYGGLDACGVCKLSNKQSEMLECDKCNQGYHMFCMDPPLSEVPEGDWFCHKCV